MKFMSLFNLQLHDGENPVKSKLNTEDIRMINENDAQSIVKEFADAQRSGYIAMCPRCGRPVMERHYNSTTFGCLSRQADVYICSDCGEEEAIEAYFHLNMLPLQKWVLFDNTENEF